MHATRNAPGNTSTNGSGNHCRSITHGIKTRFFDPGPTQTLPEAWYVEIQVQSNGFARIRR